MGLDPDSLSQVEAASISAGLTKYQPLPLLFQYQRSNGRAFIDYLLVTRLTDAERETLASSIRHHNIAEPNITHTEHIPDTKRPLGWLSVQTSHRNSLRQGAHEIEIALSFKPLHL